MSGGAVGDALKKPPADQQAGLGIPMPQGVANPLVGNNPNDPNFFGRQVREGLSGNTGDIASMIGKNPGQINSAMPVPPQMAQSMAPWAQGLAGMGNNMMARGMQQPMAPPAHHMGLMAGPGQMQMPQPITPVQMNQQLAQHLGIGGSLFGRL